MSGWIAPSDSHIDLQCGVFKGFGWGWNEPLRL